MEPIMNQLLYGIFIQFFFVLWTDPFMIENADEAYPSSVGWRIQSTNPDEWKPDSTGGSWSVHDNQVTVFMISNSSISWTLTTEPIWVYRFSQLKFRFRAHGFTPDSTRPILLLNPGSIGPVTPNAVNPENPFARAGSCQINIPDHYYTDNQIHEITQFVYPPIKTEQIDQIMLTLQTGDQPGVFEIFDLSFHDSSLPDRAIIQTETLQPIQPNQDRHSIEPISIPGQSTFLHELGDWSADQAWAECEGIHFRVDAPIASTGFQERDEISISVNERCGGIYLLLGAFLAGTDAAFQFVPRTEIRVPERLIVTKEYDDGTTEQSFPYQLGVQDYVVSATQIGCYVIPVKSTKTLQRLTIRENLSYGQIFLIAASRTDDPVSLPEPWYPASLPDVNVSIPESAPRIIVEENRWIHIENQWYEINIDANRATIVSMKHKSIDRTIMTTPTPLFSIRAGGLVLSRDHIVFQSHRNHGRGIDLMYQLHTEPNPMIASVSIQPSSSSTCLFFLQIENTGYTPQSLRIRFPNLQGLQISDSVSDDTYLFPKQRAAWGNQPIRLEGIHSGDFPYQFMDLYSERMNAGLALHTRDTQLIEKRFRYDKSASESRMGIDYGVFGPIEIQTKQTFQSPPTVFEFHVGDWRQPFNRYRGWWVEQTREERPSRSNLNQVFVCRRDYPIGGTGYLYDPIQRHYTFSRLIQETTEAIGGIDMIDISGWAYSDERGRVGEYNRYELGGMESLKREIDHAARHGIPTGLYFEGYLVDPRSTIGSAKGKEWQLIDRAGQGKVWSGNEELFLCPFHPDWRQHFSQTIRQTVNDTQPAAVYIDQFGFANEDKVCYSITHGHRVGIYPVISEHAMLSDIRESLRSFGRPVSIYTEQVPNDITSQLVDAAFDYSLYGGRPYQSPAKLHLFRFAFPSFKVIQLFHPGIEPRATSEEDAKLCFFYGEALWLKGRLRSWYSDECRDFILKANEIFHRYIDLFSSDQVDPMIPTGIRGIYANRFRKDNQELVTLYNATLHTKSGILISIPSLEVQIQDIWGMDGFELVATDATSNVAGSLPPHGIGCIWIRHQSKAE